MQLHKANPNIIKEYMSMGLNIMLIGPHGIGKTQILQQVTEDLGWNLYTFNAALVDPFVDITGVPQVYGSGEEQEMKLVRNKELDNADVIFFDEINRANTNVLNAIMNLVNERKINNEVLPKLKCIVAASNPTEDDTTGQSYSVGFLDPAQMDRFDVTMSLSERVDVKYLTKALGNKEVAEVLADWQNSLVFSSGDMQRSTYVSPRRIEKMGKLFMRIPKKSTLEHSLGVDAAELNINSLFRKLKTAVLTDEEDNREKTLASIVCDEYVSGNISEWVLDNSALIDELDQDSVDNFIKGIKDNTDSEHEYKEVKEELRDAISKVIKSEKGKGNKINIRSWTMLFVRLRTL